MELLNEEELGDPSNYEGLSPWDTLTSICEKLWEKEQKIENNKMLEKLSIRGSTSKESKIGIKMEEKRKIPSKRNRNRNRDRDRDRDKGKCVVITPEFQGLNDDKAGPSHVKIEIRHHKNRGTMAVVKKPSKSRSRSRGQNDHEAGPSDRVQEKRNRNRGKEVMREKRSQKRGRSSDNDYDEEEEEEEEETRRRPAQKKAEKPEPKLQNSHFQNLPPPNRVLKKIHSIGGTEVKFVIEKAITETDLKRNQNRLSMPVLKCSVELLELIGGKDIRVVVMFMQLSDNNDDDSTIIESLNFTKWHSRVTGYAFNAINGTSPTWYHFAVAANLEEGDVVSIWTFRLPHGRHGFVIVKD